MDTTGKVDSKQLLHFGSASATWCWRQEAKLMRISNSKVWSSVFRLQRCFLVIDFQKSESSVFEIFNSRVFLYYECLCTVYVCKHYLARNVRSMSVVWTSIIEQVYVSTLPPNKVHWSFTFTPGTPCIGVIIKWIKLNKFGNSVESCRIEQDGMIYLSFSFSILLFISVLSFNMLYLFFACGIVVGHNCCYYICQSYYILDNRKTELLLSIFLSVSVCLSSICL